MTLKSSNGTESLKETWDPENVNKDPLTEVIGQFGRFHFITGLLMSLTIIINAWMMMSNKWLTHNVDHWCARPPHISNMSADQWKNISAPMLDDEKYDSCHIFDTEFNINSERPSEDAPIVPCTSWEYDTSLFEDTATERWDLVCDQKHWRKIIQMVFFTGNFIGVFISGFIADKFGRKLCYLLLVTLFSLFGSCGSFISNFYVWLVFRFICGAVGLGYNNAMSVYLVELCHDKWRAIFDTTFRGFNWRVGVLSVAGIAYACRNMKALELIIGLSNIPFLVFFCWFLPESPRWLLAEGKKNKALKVILKICKMNNRPILGAQDLADTYCEQKMNTGNFFDLFKHPSIRRNTLALFVSWLCISCGYYGLLYNTPSMNWNIFIVYALPTFTCMVLIPLELYLQNRLGRKAMLSLPLIFSGILLITTMLFPRESISIFIANFVATVFCQFAFTDAYIFTKELYPTNLRAQALSSGSALGRIGSIISPFIAMLENFHILLPMVTYGAMLFLAGFLSIWIWPETRAIRLPDNLEDCKQLTEGKNLWIAWASCEGKDSQKKENRKNIDFHKLKTVSN